MATSKRCYKQFCSVARALDVVGERWTLLIVRDLLLGPWRYSDLMARLPGVTTNLLAERLKEMEATGLIRKHAQASVGSPHVYELTELGWQLEPAVLALADFGMRFMASGPQEGDQFDIGRALLGLKKRCRGTGKGLVTLCFPSSTAPIYYQIRYQSTQTDVRHGKPWQSDTEVTLSPSAMTALLYRGGDASAMEQRGEIVVIGDRATWVDFLVEFGLR